jgi:citrate synthase
VADTSKLIPAAEAARRLGVQPATLYAYVSRGLLQSHRLAGERGSWFDPAEIEAHMRGGRSGRSAPDLTVASAITHLEERNLSYRGHDVVALSHTKSFEAVASLLWTGELHDERFEAPKQTTRAVGQATRWLGIDARLADRLTLVVVAAATADPLRFDLSPSAVCSVGRVLIAAMVDSIPVLGASPVLPVDESAVEGSIAGRLWTRLTPGVPPAAAASVLNGFLVLLADHELATSTLAARVAASTRANPYAAVTAALGAMDGPLHGTVSEEVHTMLTEAAGSIQASGPNGATATVAARLRRGQRRPGFGHPLYPFGDPRGAAGLELLRRLASDDAGVRRRLRVVDHVTAAVTARTPASPNTDFSLGALAFVTGMAPDAGEAIFAIARTAGWIAHALEEYGEAPLRYRVRAVYTGPRRAGPDVVPE